jgi:hypothetical protein
MANEKEKIIDRAKSEMAEFLEYATCIFYGMYKTEKSAEQQAEDFGSLAGAMRDAAKTFDELSIKLREATDTAKGENAEPPYFIIDRMDDCIEDVKEITDAYVKARVKTLFGDNITRQAAAYQSYAFTLRNYANHIERDAVDLAKHGDADDED